MAQQLSAGRLFRLMPVMLESWERRTGPSLKLLDSPNARLNGAQRGRKNLRQSNVSIRPPLLLLPAAQMIARFHRAQSIGR